MRLPEDMKEYKGDDGFQLVDATAAALALLALALFAAVMHPVLV